MTLDYVTNKLKIGKKKKMSAEEYVEDVILTL